jgi:hypothetical protein
LTNWQLADKRAIQVYDIGKHVVSNQHRLRRLEPLQRSVETILAVHTSTAPGNERGITAVNVASCKRLEDPAEACLSEDLIFDALLQTPRVVRFACSIKRHNSDALLSPDGDAVLELCPHKLVDEALLKARDDGNMRWAAHSSMGSDFKRAVVIASLGLFPLLDGLTCAAHKVERVYILILQLQILDRVLLVDAVVGRLLGLFCLLARQVWNAGGEGGAKIEAMLKEEAAGTALERDFTLKVEALAQQRTEVDVVGAQNIFVGRVVEAGACDADLENLIAVGALFGLCIAVLQG